MADALRSDDPQLLKAVARAASEAGRFSAAAQALTGATERADFSLSPRPRVGFLIEATAMWTELGDRGAAGMVLEQALDVARHVKRPWRAGALADVALAAGRIPQNRHVIVQALAEAEAEAAAVKSPYPRARAWIDVGRAHRSLGERPAALCSVHRAHEAAKCLDPFDRGVVDSMDRVVNAFLELRDYDAALDCSRSIANQRWRGAARCRIAMALHADGDLDRATAALEAAMEDAASLDGWEGDELRVKVAVGYATLGDIEAATSAVNGVDHPRIETHVALARAYSSAGADSAATAETKSALDSGVQLELAERTHGYGQQVTSVARLLADRGQLDQARELLRHASAHVEAASRSDWAVRRSWPLAEDWIAVAEAQRDLGSSEGIEETLEHALAFADRLTRSRGDAGKFLTSLAQVL